LVSERDFGVDVLLRLGYGTCSLQAAVSTEDSAQVFGDLDGRRIATSHPRIAAQWLAEQGIKADIVRVTGSVEISPRLGLADAIIDLVSTGSTLRTNGLRSLGTLFESEAVLVGRRGSGDLEAQRTLTMLLASVINARATRYLLCNIAEERLGEVTALLPTTGSPTVMALATPGIVAVHALVPAAQIWSLLPQLQACGASSILTLPVERMMP
jgi:ATP phosphoribosyltransferase